MITFVLLHEGHKLEWTDISDFIVRETGYNPGGGMTHRRVTFRTKGGIPMAFSIGIHDTWYVAGLTV